MAKQNNPKPKPSQKPSERGYGNKGRTTPKPPVRPKKTPSK